jgi:CRP-like cAMP-binding protein
VTHSRGPEAAPQETTSVFLIEERPAAAPPASGTAVPPTPCAICATRDYCLVGASPQSVAALAPVIRERSFRQGDVLLRDGDRACDLQLLKIGTVFVGRTRGDGAMQPVGIGARGTVLGLCGYAGQPNQLSVIASTSGRSCEIPLARVASLAQNDPVFGERIGRAFSDNIAFMARWAQLRGHRGVVAQVAGTVALIVEEQHTEAIDVPSHTALARMLGTTRESVARAIGALEAAGCLVRTGARRCDVNSRALREWLAANA